MASLCTSPRTNGLPCHGVALRGSKFCFSHGLMRADEPLKTDNRVQVVIDRDGVSHALQHARDDDGFEDVRVQVFVWPDGSLRARKPPE